MVVKFFLQVSWFQYRNRSGALNKSKESWEKLVQKQAKEFKEKALKLEGLMIKMGQFLSTRADIMPEAFTDELKDLIDRVPSIDWDEAKVVLEKEWNAPYETLFSDISKTPVASASIGIVYKGMLENGEQVAVKIRRPDIEKVVSSDFKAIQIVSTLAKKFTKWGKTTNLDVLNRELIQTISKELDFRIEQEHALKFAKLYTDQFNIKVPYYYSHLVSEKVLVMEWIEGNKITDLANLQNTSLELDDVVHRLVGCFLNQFLNKGFFHADPHPGNIFIQEDGTIVFLDFGMMGQIPPSAKRSIQKLITSVILQDYQSLVNALEELGFLQEGVDKTGLARALEMGLDLYFNKSIKEVDDQLIDQMMQELRDFVQKQPIQLPAEYAFLGRAFSIVTGVISTMKPSVDFLEEGKPFVQEWLNTESGSEAGNFSFDVIKDTVIDLGREWLFLPRVAKDFIAIYRNKEERVTKRKDFEFLLQFYLSKQRFSFITSVFFMLLGIAAYFYQMMPLTALLGTASLYFFINYTFFGRKQANLILSYKGEGR